MCRITYTPQQRRWHQLIRGVLKTSRQIIRGTYLPPSKGDLHRALEEAAFGRPHPPRGVVHMKAFVPKHPAEVLSLIDDAQRAHTRRRLDIERKYRQDIYDAIALLYRRPPTHHTLLTKPWKWARYWEPLSYVAFKHYHRRRYQRKQIPHGKRGYDKWSTIKWIASNRWPNGDWFPRRYA